MYIVTFNIGDTDVSKDILNNSSENMSECEKKMLNIWSIYYLDCTFFFQLK